MRSTGTFVNGFLLGAGLVYLFDPDRGARRRALVRDRIGRTGRKAGEALETTARDLRNRSVGAVAEIRAAVRTRRDREAVPDEVLAERVRSAIGRVVSHPGAITVTASEGRVTLGGRVLAGEVDRLLARAARVRGVEDLVNELEVHAEPNNVPDLQGGRPRAARPEPLQEHWAPTTRLLVGTLGGLALLAGIRRRGPAGAMAGLVGLGLLGRAATNLPGRRLSGLGAGRRAVDVQKTMEVDAPPDRVWRLWSDFESFPRFMTHLRSVRETGPGRWRWVVDGPLGTPLEWEAVVTRWKPERLVGWKTVAGSRVEHAGVVRFEPNRRGGTRITLRLSYNPPAGAIGHAVASFFGADPKRQMDEDLLRLKSLLETGKTTGKEEQVTVDEVVAPSTAPSTSPSEERSGP